MFADELTAWMTEMPAEELATRLTGGVTVGRAARRTSATVVGRALRPTDFVLAPLPNQLFMRDTSAWIYGGVSINSMFWPARQHETLNVEAVYRFHPRFRDAGVPIWFGGVDHDWGSATIEGGDMMPVGDGVVLVGQGERSNARAVSILAKNLFAAGAARLVIGAQMPRDARGDAPRHGLHVLRPQRRDDLRAGRLGRSCRSSTAPTATAACAPRSPTARSSTRSRTRSGSTDLTLVATGGDEFEAERNQWDDGNNVVALSPGVDRRLRAQRGHQRQARQGRHRGPRDRRPGARPRARRRPLHDLPDLPRRLKGPA